KNGKHIMKIFEETETIWLGREDKKLIPTNLGKSVNHFLLENFREMVDYEFTAKMEEELDDISNGRRTWNEVVEIFYNKLKPIVDKMSKKKSLAERTERLLGVDGEGNQIFVVQTKFGPRVKKKVGSKFVYAKLEEPLTLDNIKLDDALKLLKYPKPVGEYDGKDVYLQKGPYGFYLIHGKDRYPIPQNVEEKEINLDLAVEIIKSELSKKIAEFILRDRTGKKIDAVLLKGPYGPYIQIVRGKRKINYPIPKNIDPTNLDEEKIWKIISKKGGSKYKPGNSMAQKRKITKRRKLI
ncbi:MAG: topoisomerase C-terminal repeat-containing protein, partial [Nitrososphaerota archaeon]